MLCDALLRCPNLKHLDINIAGDVDDCNLLKSIPSFAGLQVLVISPSSVLPFERVTKLLGSCKKLTRAEFHRVEGPIRNAGWTDHVSGIRSLAINAITNMSVYAFPENLVSSILHPVRTQPD